MGTEKQTRIRGCGRRRDQIAPSQADVEPRGPLVRPASAERGLSMIEVLIGASILAIALLGHTASIFSEHELSKSQRARSTAILACEQFMERLRSDDDWAGLYGRLNTLREIAVRAGGGSAGDTLKTVAAQPWFSTVAVLSVAGLAKTNHAYLEDGRVCFPPQVYFSDFAEPSGLLGFHIHVDVPAAGLAADPSGRPVLREDLPLPRFGLPSDLNGDGAIDHVAHDSDYRAIPVIVTIRWTHSNGASEEFRIASWIEGYRP